MMFKSGSTVEPVLTQKQIIRISKEWDENFAPGDLVELRNFSVRRSGRIGIVIGVEERFEMFMPGTDVKKSTVHVMWTAKDATTTFGTHQHVDLFHIVLDDDDDH